MTNLVHKLFLLLIPAIAFSCASSYHPVAFQELSYSVVEKDSIEVAYRYNVLQEAGNNKYSKREDKNNIRLVAIRVTNNSGSTIVFNKNVDLLADGKRVEALPEELVYSKLKQGVPIYLLYGLVWFYSSDCNGMDCNTTYIPVGLLFAGGNMVVAAGANSDFKDQLYNNYLWGKTIKDGETVYGFIAIQDIGYVPLSVELR